MRSDSVGTNIIQTWACSCGRKWKIELRETAALANADDDVTHWIERYPPESVAEVLLAAIICAELETSRGTRSRLPTWARNDIGDPNYEEIAQRGHQALNALAVPG